MSCYDGPYDQCQEGEHEDNPWETDGDLSFLPTSDDEPGTWDAADWPQDMAGPEYWLWLRSMREEGDDDDDTAPPFQR